MKTMTAHLGIYNTLADWEPGYLLVELRTGRFTGTTWDIVTVAESREPITTMGGLRVVPDMLLEDLDPASSNLLILPGADMWDAGGGGAFAAAAARFLDVWFPWRRSVVPPRVSPELECSTGAATPARQPTT
jgi:hypothetical protein